MARTTVGRPGEVPTVSLSPPQHFTFGTAAFSEVVAHHGEGVVDAARVLERSGAGALRFVDLVVVPPTHTIGAHTHGADEEIYVVVDGIGEMTVDGSTVPVTSGDVVVNRPGGTHSLVNTGTEPLRLVVVEVALRG